MVKKSVAPFFMWTRCIMQQIKQSTINYIVSRKKGTDSILVVTSTNLDNFSQFLPQVILTICVTEKL